MTHSYRPATVEDIPALVELGQSFFSESHLADFSCYAPDRVRTMLDQLIQGDRSVVWLSEFDGRLTGFIGGSVQAVWCADVDVAVELAWWVDPLVRGTNTALRLLQMFEVWAHEHGARGVVMTDIVDLPQASMLFSRMGYSVVERSHFKGLN